MAAFMDICDPDIEKMKKTGVELRTIVKLKKQVSYAVSCKTFELRIKLTKICSCFRSINLQSKIKSVIIEMRCEHGCVR